MTEIPPRSVDAFGTLIAGGYATLAATRWPPAALVAVPLLALGLHHYVLMLYGQAAVRMPGLWWLR